MSTIAYRLAHKEEIRAQSKEYRVAHCEEVDARHKKYVAEHPEAMRALGRKLYAKHRGEVCAQHNVYRIEHPEEVRATKKKYYAGHRSQCIAGVNMRYRALGFNPLNSFFVGSEGHHINRDDVIFMPHKLHHSIAHNVFTGKGMAEINALAGRFLTEDWT